MNLFGRVDGRTKVFEERTFTHHLRINLHDKVIVGPNDQRIDVWRRVHLGLGRVNEVLLLKNACLGVLVPENKVDLPSCIM